MTVRIACLVSMGQHPISKRPRRAETDARALELALRIESELTCGLDEAIVLDVIHAGQPDNIAMQGYLGMGVSAIKVLETPAGLDICDGLVTYLQTQTYDLILTGTASETAESSGMLPYNIAKGLGCSIVSNVAGIAAVQDNAASVIQALPRGQRRALAVSLPTVMTIGMAAAKPRQSAFGVAKKGELIRLSALVLSASATGQPEYHPDWRVERAQKKPKRLKIVKATTAADRFKAATSIQGNDGKVLNVPAKEGAKAILDYLKEEGIV